MCKLLFIVFLFCSAQAYSQSFFPRSSSAVTPVDARLKASLNLYIPLTTDTTLNGGLDTLGAILYVKSGTKQGLWVRDSIAAGGHIWAKQSLWVLSSNTLQPTSATYNVSVGSNSAYKFNVTKGLGKMYFDGKYLVATNDSTKDNIAIGVGAMNNNTANNYNTAIGSSAGRDLSGNDQIIIGYSAASSTVGNKNVFIGNYSGNPNDGSNNSLVGYFSGLYGYGSQLSGIGSQISFGRYVDSANLNNSVITTSTSTIVGASVASFITATGLALNAYADFSMTFYGTPPSIGGTPTETTIYFKGQVTASNTIRTTLSAFTAAGSGTFNITHYTNVTNSSAIGYNANADTSNQVALGNSSTTVLKVGAVKIYPTSPTNGYALVYSSSAGGYTPQAVNATIDYSFQTLTDGATITWNVADQFNAKVTLGGNRTLAMTNVTVGKVYTVYVTQDGTGNRTLTLPANSKVPIGFGTGTTINLSTAGGAIDELCVQYNGTNYFWTIAKQFQ